MNGYFQKVFRSLGNEMQNRNTYSFFYQIIVAIFYYVDNSPSTTPTAGCDNTYPFRDNFRVLLGKILHSYFHLKCEGNFLVNEFIFTINWNILLKFCNNHGDCRGSWILILWCFICPFVENGRVQMSQM